MEFCDGNSENITWAYMGIKPSGNWCRGGLLTDCIQNPVRAGKVLPIQSIWLLEQRLQPQNCKSYVVSEKSADSCISAWRSMLCLASWFVLLKLRAQMQTMWRQAWRETVGVEDTWTFTARDWTQHDNPPNGQIVEKGTRSDEKLRWLVRQKRRLGLRSPKKRSNKPCKVSKAT
jgi:hypothetical protein